MSWSPLKKEKKEKCRQGMNGHSFSQNLLTQGWGLHHHNYSTLSLCQTRNIYFDLPGWGSLTSSENIGFTGMHHRGGVWPGKTWLYFWLTKVLSGKQNGVFQVKMVKCHEWVTTACAKKWFKNFFFFFFSEIVGTWLIKICLMNTCAKRCSLLLIFFCWINLLQ